MLGRPRTPGVRPACCPTPLRLPSSQTPSCHSPAQSPTDPACSYVDPVDVLDLLLAPSPALPRGGGDAPNAEEDDELWSPGSSVSSLPASPPSSPVADDGRCHGQTGNAWGWVMEDGSEGFDSEDDVRVSFIPGPPPVPGWGQSRLKGAATPEDGTTPCLQSSQLDPLVAVNTAQSQSVVPSAAEPCTPVRPPTTHTLPPLISSPPRVSACADGNRSRQNSGRPRASCNEDLAHNPLKDQGVRRRASRSSSRDKDRDRVWRRPDSGSAPVRPCVRRRVDSGGWEFSPPSQQRHGRNAGMGGDAVSMALDSRREPGKRGDVWTSEEAHRCRTTQHNVSRRHGEVMVPDRQQNHGGGRPGRFGGEYEVKPAFGPRVVARGRGHARGTWR